MVLAVEANMATTAINEVCTKVAWLYPWMNPVFTVGGLLALVESGDLNGIVGDIKVAVFITVVDTASAAVDLRAFRYVDVEQLFSIQFSCVNG